MDIKSGTSREDFLAQGAIYVKDTLGEQADFAVGLKRQKDLADIVKTNQNIISDDVLTNKRFPKRIQKTIESYRNEVKKIISATAAHIERNKFETVEEAVSDLQSGEAEMNKVTSLLRGQRKLSCSFETVAVAVDLFSLVNEQIREEIKETSPSKAGSKYTDLMLKNAILIYELTTFLINYLEEYSLTGVDDLEKVKQEVENDFLHPLEDQLRHSEEQAISHSGDEEASQQLLTNIEERRKVVSLVRERWSKFDSKIESLQGGVNTLKSIIPDLKLRKLDAQGQILTLQVVQLVRAFDANLSLINKVADLKKLAVEPFTVDDARILLGFETVGLESNKNSAL